MEQARQRRLAVLAIIITVVIATQTARHRPDPSDPAPVATEQEPPPVVPVAKEQDPPLEAPVATEQEPPLEVAVACAACHVLPPPASLPRQRWAELIPQMRDMPLLPGMQPMRMSDMQVALYWYTSQAPDSLPPPPEAAPTDTQRFSVEHLTPPGLGERRIPAVANVSFMPFLEKQRPDLLVAELRSQSLLHLAPWAPPRHRRLRPLQIGLEYPAHVSQADVDADGRDDFLVACLGDLTPSNATRGSVWLLRQEEGFELVPHQVLKGQGRVSDARSADLDGDGDQDLVVAVFGWRGPGRLLVLENRGGDGPIPEFVEHELDPRDGWIHVEPVDMDGDGALDLVTVVSQEHEQVVMFRGSGNGLQFERQVIHQAPHPAWGYSGLEVVDLDADGDPDLLLSNGDSLDDDLVKPYHGVAWLENRGREGFAHHPIASLPGCERAVAGDIDGDGDLDVVAVAFLPQLSPQAWKSRDLVSVLWVERAGDEWRPHALEKHRCYHPTVALADHNGDGKLDIAVGNFVWLDRAGRSESPADYLTLFTAR